MTRYPQPREQDRLETKYPRCPSCGQFMTEKSQDMESSDEAVYWWECVRCGFKED